LESPQIMGANIPELAEKLGADPGLRREFAAVYGSGPDACSAHISSMFGFL
jgi:cytochrome c peroxidase